MQLAISTVLSHIAYRHTLQSRWTRMWVCVRVACGGLSHCRSHAQYHVAKTQCIRQDVFFGQLNLKLKLFSDSAQKGYLFHAIGRVGARSHMQRMARDNRPRLVQSR